MIFSTTGVILRRLEYGDSDLILSLITRDKGKISVIAKSAKKSTKRFGGLLELFSLLDIVCTTGKGKGLAVLQEASLNTPLGSIRSDYHKTAHASYWSELMDKWLEEGHGQPELYRLLVRVLRKLDHGELSGEQLNVLYQSQFLRLSGLRPNLERCVRCGRQDSPKTSGDISFDLGKGGILCDVCTGVRTSGLRLSKGTVRQLQWLSSENYAKAERIRLSPESLSQAQNLLEDFVQFHLGKVPKSLKFLRQIRKERD